MNRNLMTVVLNIGSVLTAGAVILVFLLLWKVFLWLGIIAAAVIVITGFAAPALLKGKPRQDMLPGSEKPAAATSDISKALSTSRERVTRIFALREKTADLNARDTIEKLCSVSADIITAVEKDPADYKKARQFFIYTLEALENIAARVIVLEKESGARESVNKALETMKSLIPSLEKTLAHISEPDVMDLDVEVQLLKKTLEENR